MRIHEIKNPSFGRVFTRISDALHKYSPDDIEWVDFNSADYYFLHTVGGKEYVRFQSLPKDRVINFQHCVHTTSLSTKKWEDMWASTLANISFHELRNYTNKNINMIVTPLGAEPDIFYPQEVGKKFAVFTTGHVAKSENIGKISDAVKQIAGGLMAHTGEDFKFGEHYKYFEYMDDGAFSRLLNQCRYVAGLRNIEGFEAHCIEGAMCGVRPIIPNLPTYHAYHEFGIYVDTKHNLVDQLVAIFERQPERFDDSTLEYIRKEFSWETIITKIFNQIGQFV